MTQGSETNFVPLLNGTESPEEINNFEQNPTSSDDSTKTSEDFIKVNVGGSSYLLKASTVKNRLPDTKLSRFVQCSHEARLCLCDAFFMVFFLSLL